MLKTFTFFQIIKYTWNKNPSKFITPNLDISLIKITTKDTIVKNPIKEMRDIYFEEKKRKKKDDRYVRRKNEK